MKIGIIILCRYDSNRLPGKILKRINGKPVLNYIIERLTYTEKQTLLENTIDDKLIDIELNIDIDDFKKIIIDHFRPNFINQKNEMIINDQNEISNEFIIPS